MVLDCCCRALKCVLIVVNVLVSVAGIVMIAFGVILYSNVTNLDMYPDSFSLNGKGMPFYASIILLAAGSLMAVIGICGCCGALRESQCMLTIFVLIVLACSIACVTGLFILTQNGKDIIRNAEEHFQKLNDTQKSQIATKLECCIKQTAKPNNNTCINKDVSLQECNVRTKMSHVVDVLTIILIVTGIIQVFAFISSLGLCCHIRKAGY